MEGHSLFGNAAGDRSMSDELQLKERLEGLQRVLRHNPELADQLVQCMIDEIDLKVEQFEEEHSPA